MSTMRSFSLVALAFIAFSLNAELNSVNNRDCRKVRDQAACTSMPGCLWVAGYNRCVAGGFSTSHYHDCSHSHHQRTCTMHSNCYWDEHYDSCNFSY